MFFRDPFSTFAKTGIMSSKGKKNKRQGAPNDELTRQVISVLSGTPQQAFNYKQISKKLNINDSSERRMVSNILRELAGKGEIVEVYQGKYRSKAPAKVLTLTASSPLQKPHPQRSIAGTHTASKAPNRNKEGGLNNTRSYQRE